MLADNSCKALLFQLQSLKNLLSIKEGVTELRGAAKWSHVGETTCFAWKFVQSRDLVVVLRVWLAFSGDCVTPQRAPSEQAANVN